MKELLQLYAAHNAWANLLLTDTIKQLPKETINQEMQSSFPSIFKTVLHLLDAESMWWQRIKLQEHIERPSEHFTGNFVELQKKLLQQSAQYEQWVAAANEFQLQHVFAYQRSKTEQCKQPIAETLLHIFNHGSFHRGQLVTLLRQAGVAKIPSTDFSTYYRQRKNHQSAKK